VLLCAQWEDKAAGHNINEAVVDLQAKTAAWTPLYYGTAQVRTLGPTRMCGCHACHETCAQHPLPRHTFSGTDSSSFISCCHGAVADVCAQYLPCFAAAGLLVQFYATPKTHPHQPVAITPTLSMADPVQKAELALYCVKVGGAQAQVATDGIVFGMLLCVCRLSGVFHHPQRVLAVLQFCCVQRAGAAACLGDCNSRYTRCTGPCSTVNYQHGTLP
jgi:hypothetical protein